MEGNNTPENPSCLPAGQIIWGEYQVIPVIKAGVKPHSGTNGAWCRSMECEGHEGRGKRAGGEPGQRSGWAGGDQGASMMASSL